MENTTTEIQLFDSTDAALAALRDDYTYLPDVDTNEGLKENNEQLRKLVKLRTGTEKLRLKFNQPHQEKIKETNEKAKAITAVIEEFETPRAKAKKRKEAEEARRKEEEANKEAIRVADIERRVGDIRNSVNCSRDLETINRVLFTVDSIDLHDGSFAEFEDAAVAAYEFASSTLQEYKAAAEAQEAEAARVREEADKLAMEREAMEKQMAEIEAEKQKLADAQAAIDEEKRKAAEEEALIKSREEAAKNAELAAAAMKMQAVKKARDNRLAAAIKAENMRQNKEKYASDAEVLVTAAELIQAATDSLSALTGSLETDEAKTELGNYQVMLVDAGRMFLRNEVIQSQRETKEAA